MARSKTKVAILKPVEDMIEGCNDLRIVETVDDQAAALNWVKEEGEFEVEYLLARVLRTATKKKKPRTVVV